VTGCAVLYTVACSGTKESSVVQETVVFSPLSDSTYDFGMVMVGSASQPKIFKLSAAGINDDDLVTAIVPRNQCGAFPLTNFTAGGEVCGMGSATTGSGSGSGVGLVLPGGVSAGCPKSVTFTVTFQPMAGNTQSCIYDIYTTGVGSGSANPSIPLTLTGFGISPMFAVSVSPTSQDFGPVNTGIDGPPYDFEIRNVGNQMLTVTPSIAGMAASKFVLSSTSQFMLPPNMGLASSQILTIRCHQPVLGPNTATFHIATQDAMTSADVPLTCTGVSTNLNVNPTPINFGSHFIGVVGDQSVSVMNNGAATTVADIIVSGTDVSLLNKPNVPFLIGTGNTLPLGSVHYTAETPQAPGTLGTLTLVMSPGPNLAYPIMGGAQSGAIGTNPAAVDFGPVCIGRTGSVDVHAYASGPADVQLTQLTGVATPVSTNFAPGMVRGNHNGELTFTTTFAPTTDSVLGATPSELAIDTNLPSASTYLLQVTGFVVPDGITATPTAVDFGTVAVDATTSGYQIVLSNCGTSGQLEVTTAEIRGVNKSSFTIVLPIPIAQTLDVGKGETFVLVMSPHTAGLQTAELVITYSGGEAHVPLTGQGDEPFTDRKTYYACSVGNGTAAWPIGLALLALRRRRRRALS